MTAAPAAPDATAYDNVAYPAWIYPQTEPSRLAAVARIHGLAAPDPATARVLEVAGGDGLNVIAMAAAWPRAQFHSFDLAATAVARGAALAAAAGLDNVRIVVGDLLEAAETLEGPFDYVIVHGLYAWVPEPVRVACMRLIGRVLAPEGIAFVSYNAKPGGHLRTALREMLLHHVEGVTDPEERLTRAYGLLKDFVNPRDTDSPPMAALRWTAAPILQRLPGTLFHDEMGEVFAPQSLTQVTEAAAAHGLAFLNDAIPGMIADGLPGLGFPEAEVVRAAQADDYQVCTFFHETLLIREGRSPRRGPVAGCLDGLWLASQCVHKGGAVFVAGEREVTIDDAELAEFLAGATRQAPDRARLGRVATTLERCEALIELHRSGFIVLHTAPAPFVVAPGERPCASTLARTQVQNGTIVLATLDLKGMAFGDEGPRRFLAMLDGTRDRAALEREWRASGYGDEIPVDMALARFAGSALMTA